jgi:hypothetical protein
VFSHLVSIACIELLETIYSYVGRIFISFSIFILHFILEFLDVCAMTKAFFIEVGC